MLADCLQKVYPLQTLQTTSKRAGPTAKTVTFQTLVAPDSQTKIAKRFNKIKGKGVESNVLLSDKI
ncbi:hypothetical protein PInf_018525 [Phytophthora infestans]|nr:hypothetical protein PInf_018525 [Phytophthora infestans]